MPKIEWLAMAREDLDGISEYIAENNQERAVSFSAEILAQTAKLMDFPLLGVQIKTTDLRPFCLAQKTRDAVAPRKFPSPLLRPSYGRFLWQNILLDNICKPV